MKSRALPAKVELRSRSPAHAIDAPRRRKSRHVAAPTQAGMPNSAPSGRPARVWTPPTHGQSTPARLSGCASVGATWNDPARPEHRSKLPNPVRSARCGAQRTRNRRHVYRETLTRPGVTQKSRAEVVIITGRDEPRRDGTPRNAPRRGRPRFDHQGQVTAVMLLRNLPDHQAALAQLVFSGRPWHSNDPTSTSTGSIPIRPPPRPRPTPPAGRGLPTSTLPPPPMCGELNR